MRRIEIAPGDTQGVGCVGQGAQIRGTNFMIYCLNMFRNKIRLDSYVVIWTAAVTSCALDGSPGPGEG